MEMNKKNMLIGGGILAALVIAIIYYSKKKTTPITQVITPTPNPNPSTDCTDGYKNTKGVCVYPKKYILSQDYSAIVPTMSPTEPESPNVEFKAGEMIIGYLNTELFPEDYPNPDPVIMVMTKIDGSLPNPNEVGTPLISFPIEILSETAGPKTFANYVDTTKNEFFQPKQNTEWHNI